MCFGIGAETLVGVDLMVEAQKAQDVLKMIEQLASNAECDVMEEGEEEWTAKNEKSLLALRDSASEMLSAACSARTPFMWMDGPLVTAMANGDMILIDELNLADDAVIERMNR